MLLLFPSCYEIPRTITRIGYLQHCALVTGWIAVFAANSSYSCPSQPHFLLRGSPILVSLPDFATMRPGGYDAFFEQPITDPSV